MSTTKERSAFRWTSILAHFTDINLLEGRHCKCPLCGGKDRFRFEPQSERGSYFCNSCGAGTGIHLLAQLMSVDHSGAWKLVDSVLETSVEVKPKEVVDRVARIRKILDACKPINPNGEVAAYLRSRGISELPEGLLEAPASGGATMMVGRLSNKSKLTGLHVTYIRGGKKEDRKMFGLREKCLMGSAIRLNPLQGGNRILVGEGIESTLSATFHNIPGWACGSAGMMEGLVIPEHITDVIIAADNDVSFTGQAAAYVLAKRLTIQKIACRVIIPRKIGTDFNDELLGDV